jgi:Tfp pilus assembly protein PilX
MKEKNVPKNDKGAVLVVVMLILLLLTLMGKGATTTATIEMGIAANERFYKKTFYIAEAGIGHIKAKLQNEFTFRNQTKIASGQIPDWDFALNGTVDGVNAATDTEYSGGAVWAEEQAVDEGERLSGHYTVTVWNNREDRGGITNDTDQLLCIRSAATGPRGTMSSVEVILRGQASGEAITGYLAQAGAQGMDVRAISDFTVQ